MSTNETEMGKMCISVRDSAKRREVLMISFLRSGFLDVCEGLHFVRNREFSI